MNIKYRQIRKEDGYEWYSLLDEVWRVTYSHIFPKEVFDGRYFIDFLFVLFLKYTDTTNYNKGDCNV